jgi:hypothetical protein
VSSPAGRCGEGGMRGADGTTTSSAQPAMHGGEGAQELSCHFLLPRLEVGAGTSSSSQVCVGASPFSGRRGGAT